MTAVSPALRLALFDWIVIVGWAIVVVVSMATEATTEPVGLLLPLPAASVKVLSYTTT